MPSSLTRVWPSMRDGGKGFQPPYRSSRRTIHCRKPARRRRSTVRRGPLPERARKFRGYACSKLDVLPDIQQWNPRVEPEPNSVANATVSGPELTKKMSRNGAAMRPTANATAAAMAALLGWEIIANESTGEVNARARGRPAWKAALTPEESGKNQQDSKQAQRGEYSNGCTIIHPIRIVERLSLSNNLNGWVSFDGRHRGLPATSRTAGC